MKILFKERNTTNKVIPVINFIAPSLPDYDCIKYLIAMAETLDLKNENKITIGQLELVKQKIDERIAKLSE